MFSEFLQNPQQDLIFGLLFRYRSLPALWHGVEAGD
jgi:hypothetical protein